MDGVADTVRTLAGELLTMATTHPQDVVRKASEWLVRQADSLDSMRARMTLVAKREAELHYAIRQTAGLIDHKLSEEEAHAMALRIVEKMRDVWQAAHDVDEAFSRDAPMMLVDTGVVASRKLERMRVVLDRPVSGPPGQ